MAICTRICDAGGRAFLVGGCVRDMLLKITPKDWDLEVFNLEANHLESLFPQECECVGKSYGIYKFRHLPLDMAIPREETCIGNHHRDFFIQSNPHLPLKQAAERRDFTINAIYLDPLNGAI
ncbi:MAG: polynucleotide adenylyltransferase, partial [Puniceicoccales bacterium]|nr:polynucleotide adenylyltransferase [Puniceicoccales bacterium]